MAIVLFDNSARRNLQPFTLTRAVADLRYGIFSGRERWALLSGQTVFVHAPAYLLPLYEAIPDGEHIWIDAAVVPDPAIVAAILALKEDECMGDKEGLIACRTKTPASKFDPSNAAAGHGKLVSTEPARRLVYPWQLMQWNDERLRADFELAVAGRLSAPLPATVTAINLENIFVEYGAILNHCIINAETGPVYIGKNAELMEGCAIRGPFSLGNNAVLKMGSRIYGATTIGPNCMGGGEIKNTVMMGYSNKAHDGYLGDSVIGEWCNFGAGSSNSNIKNTAGDVKVWSMGSGGYISVGQKCGVIMGDYSRAAINSSINTGSMIGVSCNVFGEGLLPTLINHFSWGVKQTIYDLNKALQDIRNWKKLKGCELSEAEVSVLKHIFEQP